MKKILIISLFLLGIQFSSAQTIEELKKEQAPIKTSIAKLQSEVNALQSKIDAFPGWKKGAFGTIGGNLSGFNNWYSKAAPNTSAGNIGITANAYANLLKDDFFWRNSLNINLGWVKIDNTDIDTDSDQFETATDVFNITSLYGKRINKKWAMSGLAEYRTTLIDKFNNPGYLDAGIGLTWTPSSKLVVVIHPGNYNFIFTEFDDVFSSSLGAKIVADYTTSIKKVNLKSNVSIFQSYESADYSNWTWTNSLGYTFWKGIGLGFEFGLRDNKQEALSYGISQDVTTTFDTVDNKLQSYWLFGLSYNIK